MKHPKIAPQMAPTHDESYHDNYGVYQHMAEGGMASHEHFQRLKDMLKKHRKANSELKASANPMKFIEDNKNMSIKGLKGVAFARGGLVKK